MTPTKIPDFNKQSVKDLKEHCIEIPLPTTGTKSQLVSRIMDYYKEKSEIKLQSLLQTPGYAEDDPAGKKKGQEIMDMFDMIASTNRQKAEAWNIEHAQKKTVATLFDVVKGAIEIYGMDIDGTGTDQKGSKEDIINEMYEAISNMDSGPGRLGIPEGKYQDYALSEEADAIVRRYIDVELATYADSDAKVLGDTEFQKSGDAWEVSRFNYRTRMRIERAAETEDRVEKAAADVQHAPELADQVSQLEAELEAEIEAGLEAAFHTGLEAEKTREMAEALTLGDGENIPQAQEESDVETYAPMEEPIEQAIEEEGDEDYEDKPKKKGTRGRAFPKKKATTKKATGGKKKKPKRKNR